MSRVVIGGGPRCGKSFAALRIARGEWSLQDGTSLPPGSPVFCGDPLSMVKEPEPGTTYLPEGLGMGSASSRWIVDNWLPMPGPWVLEGHVMARVLRKWMGDAEPDAAGIIYPCDRIIMFREQRPGAVTKPGQVAQHKGVMSVWNEIDLYYEPITEYR